MVRLMTTSNRSGLDSAEVISDNGGHVVIIHPLMDKDGVDDGDDYKVKLKCMFDQLLSVFSKETDEQGVVKPMPARLGDGRVVDLFMLFWVVKERHGFDYVEKKCLWPSVVQELGLDLKVSPSVKLIYVKYLYQLEKWFETNCKSSKLEHREFEARISSEIGAELSGLFLNGSDQKVKDNDNDLVRLDSVENDKDAPENELCALDTGKVRKKQECEGKTGDDSSKFCDDDEMLDNNNIINGNDHGIVNSEVAQELNSRKRKRDSLVGMLNWVIQIAKCPRDSSIGPIPELSTWKAGVGDETWVQAIRARDALFFPRHVPSAVEESPLQNNKKLHPSMYEDIVVPNHQPTERIRSSERLPARVKSRSHKIELENGPKDRGSETDDSSYTKPEITPHKDGFPRRHVCVGRLFQAEVPMWTGVVESDSKWLGTRVWPSEQILVGTELIGKERRDSCVCRAPGSVDCIRFHIAENRMKLKLELGSVFFRWQFDRMGEEVTLRWTVEEEKRFKELLKLNASFLIKGFRQNGTSKWFPKMMRENLISYYFNVFILQRRRYQNRVNLIPEDIDSDDDESELGTIGGSFGHEAIKVLGSDILICSLNNQCFDYQ